MTSQKLINLLNMDQDLIEYMITRNEQGTKLYLKSKIVGDFFEKYIQETNQDYEWSSNYPHNITKLKIYDSRYNSLREGWKQSNLMLHGRANLSFLRTVGLKNGVNFLLTQPIPEKEIKRFQYYFKSYVSDFYLEYIIPLTIREVIKPKKNPKKIKKGLENIEYSRDSGTFDRTRFSDQYSEAEFVNAFRDSSDIDISESTRERTARMAREEDEARTINHINEPNFYENNDEQIFTSTSNTVASSRGIRV